VLSHDIRSRDLKLVNANIPTLSFHGSNGDEIVTFVGCNGVDSRYRYCRVIKFSVLKRAPLPRRDHLSRKKQEVWRRHFVKE